MDAEKITTYLCGMVAPWSESSLSRGVIELRNGASVSVTANDPGLAKVKVGKQRMVVVRYGKILAVYGRPRIRLIHLINRGALISTDLLECYSPMYLKEF